MSVAASFQTGASDYEYVNRFRNPLGAADESASNDSAIRAVQETASGQGLGNATTANLGGVFYLYAPSSTAFHTHMDWTATYRQSSNSRLMTGYGSGVFKGSASAVDGVRFFMESGNIAEGAFKLFGIQKS